MEFCFSCMNRIDRGQPCQRCGYINGPEETPVHHLAPGSILSGKYMIGKAIGEGGFGITYVGMDLNLERKVAIKEYFPTGIVTRNSSETITVFSGDSEKYFFDGRDKFINEAKALAKMDKLPGIVAVIDFFMENGTSYIVMEFIEGMSLKEMLKNRTRMDSEEVFNMLRSLISSLQEIHKLGIIHRDISPDNIMITEDSQVKLIDFGAARNVADDKSLSIQLKPGYAPEEQYRTHGKQGPWTDVYAICATMYRAITGTMPPEALERIREDILKTPTELGVDMSYEKEQVLMRGLALYHEQRLQSMDDLYNGLYAGVQPPPRPAYNVAQPAYHAPMTDMGVQNRYTSDEKKSRNLFVSAVVIAVTAVLLALCVVFFALNIGSNKKDEINDAQVTVTDAPTTAPAVTVQPKTIYRISTYSPGLTYKRMDEIHNSVASDDSMLPEMNEFIGKYVVLCDNYMNIGSEEIFRYLVPDTTAYNQQTAYKEKHPLLTQQCLSYSVQDVRQHGGYYYVWDTEELSETENGSTKVTTSHWVYKIMRSGDTYQVVDYTYDPAYK